MKKSEVVKTSLYVPPKLRQQLKILAAKRMQTMGELIIEFLQKGVDEAVSSEQLGGENS